MGAVLKCLYLSLVNYPLLRNWFSFNLATHTVDSFNEMPEFMIYSYIYISKFCKLGGIKTLD